MAGLDADDASYYGHGHVGDNRRPARMAPGMLPVDYEYTTWELTPSGVRKLLQKLPTQKAEKGEGAPKRELIKILRGCLKKG